MLRMLVVIKEVRINLHIFSRNLEARLPGNKYLVFNLLLKNNRPVFEIIDTNSEAIKAFCQRRKRHRFTIGPEYSIEINNHFTLIFD